ncbi:MAG: hypothetical protein P4M13_08690 [Alphaproteobacteria bacterium]|nr:hypothetical protein [Alphaproteobacteria bacterium]
MGTNSIISTREEPLQGTPPADFEFGTVSPRGALEAAVWSSLGFGEGQEKTPVAKLSKISEEHLRHFHKAFDAACKQGSDGQAMVTNEHHRRVAAVHALLAFAYEDVFESGHVRVTLVGRIASALKQAVFDGHDKIRQSATPDQLRMYEAVAALKKDLVNGTANKNGALGSDSFASYYTEEGEKAADMLHNAKPQPTAAQTPSVQKTETTPQAQPPKREEPQSPSAESQTGKKKLLSPQGSHRRHHRAGPRFSEEQRLIIAETMGEIKGYHPQDKSHYAPGNSEILKSAYKGGLKVGTEERETQQQLKKAGQAADKKREQLKKRYAEPTPTTAAHQNYGDLKNCAAVRNTQAKSTQTRLGNTSHADKRNNHVAPSFGQQP